MLSLNLCFRINILLQLLAPPFGDLTVTVCHPQHTCVVAVSAPVLSTFLLHMSLSCQPYAGTWRENNQSVLLSYTKHFTTQNQVLTTVRTRENVLTLKMQTD